VSPQIVFYQAGVDPLQSDRLGRLALSRDGLQRRNEFVYQLLRPLVDANRCGVVLTLGGGALSPYPAPANPSLHYSQDSVFFQWWIVSLAVTALNRISER
jgi:hypothetical protein